MRASVSPVWFFSLLWGIVTKSTGGAFLRDRQRRPVFFLPLKKLFQAGHSDCIEARSRYSCDRNALPDRLRCERVSRLLSAPRSRDAPLSAPSFARSVLFASASDSEPEQEQVMASAAHSLEPPSGPGSSSTEETDRKKKNSSRKKVTSPRISSVGVKKARESKKRRGGKGEEKKNQDSGALQKSWRGDGEQVEVEIPVSVEGGNDEQRTELRIVVLWRCARCGALFEKERGLHIHAAQKHNREGQGDSEKGRDLCIHHRVEKDCSICRPRIKVWARCEHGRQRSKCKECGGSSICEHGRQRSRCKECRSTRLHLKKSPRRK